MSGEGVGSLQEAAAIVERHRKWNPMNGDGSNYTIDRILASLDRFDPAAGVLEAAAAERDRQRQKQADEDERIEEMNRRRREEER